MIEADKTYEYMKTLGNLELPGNPSHRLIPGLLRACPTSKHSLSLREWCPGAGLPCKIKEGIYGDRWTCSICERVQGRGKAMRHKWYKPAHGENCRCLGTKDIVIGEREWLAALLDAAKNIGDVTFIQLSQEEVILKTHHQGYGATPALALADAFYAYYASYRPEE